MKHILLIINLFITTIAFGQLSPQVVDSLVKVRVVASNSRDLATVMKVTDLLIEHAEQQSIVDSLKLIQEWTNKAATYSRLDQQKEALLWLEKAYVFCSMDQYYTEYLHLLKTFGRVYAKLQKNDLAISSLEKAIQAVEQKTPSNPSIIPSLYSEVANAYLVANQQRPAILYYNKALQLLEEQGDSTSNLYSTNIQLCGLSYVRTGDFIKAERFYKKAIKIVNNSPNSSIYRSLSLLNALGHLYAETNRYTESLEQFQTATKLAEEKWGKTHNSYASALNNIAIVSGRMHHYEQAQSSFLEVLAIYDQLELPKGHQKYLSIQANLAHNYTALKEYETALSLYQAVLQGFEKMGDTVSLPYYNTINNLTQTYLNLNNYEVSTKLSSKAMNGFKRLLGKHSNNYFDALHHLALSQTYDQKVEPASKSWKELMSLFNYQLQQQFFYFSEAEKLEVIHDRLGNFERFALFCIQHPSDDLMMHFQNTYLQTKGLVLNSHIQTQTFAQNSSDPQTINTYHQWKALRLQLHDVLTGKRPEIEAAAIQKEINQLERELALTSPQLAFQLQEQRDSTTLKDIQAHLDKNTVIIDFIHIQDYHKTEALDTVWYYALLSTNNSQAPKAVRLCHHFDLEHFLQHAIHKTGQNYITDPANNQQLWKLIWAPLEPFLKNIKTIYLSPSGLMHQISFEAIRSKKNKHLIDLYQLHYVSNIKEIIPSANARSSTKSIHLLGGASFDLDSLKLAKLAEGINAQNTALDTTLAGIWRGHTRSLHFTNLPGSLREVEHIHQQFQQQKWSSQLFIGDAALEDNLPRTAPTILHLATHGFVFSEPQEKDQALSILRQRVAYAKNPLMRTGLAFAGANYFWKGGSNIPGIKDGILTAYEAMLLDLKQTELVVLSACETGIGDINQTDGVMGLQRAFKIAGAQQIISSLWRVDDQATTLLMQQFYKYYLKNWPVSKALRKAKKWLKKQKKYRSPYFWAAFVLIK